MRRSSRKRAEPSPASDDDCAADAPPGLEDDAACQACRRRDQAESMVLCDGGGCDSGCHLHCMAPPRAAVPAGDWFCSACSAAGAAAAGPAAEPVVFVNEATGARLAQAGCNERLVANLLAKRPFSSAADAQSRVLGLGRVKVGRLTAAGISFVGLQGAVVGSDAPEAAAAASPEGPGQRVPLAARATPPVAAPVFARWRPGAAAVAANCEAYAAVLAAESCAVRFDGAAAATVPLFRSAVLDAGSGSQAGFAGGCVWAMDWCPADGELRVQYLAVAAHPDKEPRHRAHHICRGKNVIQLWEVGAAPSAASESGGSRGMEQQAGPSVALLLAHDGGLVWSMQWCPAGAYDKPTFAQAGVLPRLGLLAVGLGSGDVCVYSVPHPASVQGRGDGAGCIKPAPVFRSRLGERVAQKVEWSPAPSDKLVAGFGDGAVAVWILDDAPTSEPLQPAVCFAASTAPITCVGFGPVGVGSDAHVFSAGFDGCTRVWDLRDTWLPATEAPAIAGQNVLATVWPDESCALISSFSDGSINLFAADLGQSKLVFQTPELGAIWDMSVHPADPRYMAVCGDDGYLALLTNLDGVVAGAATFDCLPLVRVGFDDQAQCIVVSPGASRKIRGKNGRKGDAPKRTKRVDSVAGAASAKLPQLTAATAATTGLRQVAVGHGRLLAFGGIAGIVVFCEF